MNKLISIALVPFFVGKVIEAAPTIQSNPSSQTLNRGATAQFSVTATGLGTISYQWQKDGIDIPGAAGASFSISQVEPWHIGDYTVKVTDLSGTLQTAPASLKLNMFASSVWKGLQIYHSLNGNVNDSLFLENNLIAVGVTEAPGREISKVSYQFYGGRSAIYKNNSKGVNASREQSLSVWIKPDSVDGRIMLFGISSDYGSRFFISLNNGFVVGAHGNDSNYQTPIFGAQPLANGVWHHIAIATKGNNSDMACYVNGVPLGVADSGFNADIEENFWIVLGSDVQSGYTESFIGTMSECRIYNKFLSASDAKQLYESYFNQPPSITNPGNQSVLQDTATNVLNVAVADQESSPGTLVLTASSSDTTLVPNTNIVLGGSGANRTVRVTPSNGQSGTATITLTLSDGQSSSSESFQLTVLPTRPLFTVDPGGENYVNPNSVIAFRLNYIAGVQPFTYRWRRNGTTISGATGSSYTIAKAQNSHEGSYDCVITNSFGSFTTLASILTVNDPVVILTPPLTQAANVGQEVTLNVNVTGTQPIEYQWRKNGTPIPDENAPGLVLVADANSGGFYDVVVSNPLGSVTSPTAALTVLVPPAITAHPSNQNVSVGSSAFFSVTATGTGLTYQWRRNGTNITGQTNAMLMVSNVQKANEGAYDVLVKNSFGAVLSNPAWLSLPQPLSITEQPQDITAAPGETASFSVTASGQGLLAYQWNKEGRPIKDAKSRTLTLPVTDAAASAGAYTVTVSSGTLKVTSAPAYLRVTDPGLLIYKFTITGNSFSGTRSSPIALTGLLIVDRLNQRGGIISYGKNGRLDTFQAELDEGLRTHSTGPITNSQTVVSKVVKTGDAPQEEIASLWLRGTDGAVTFSATDKTIAPRTLAGFQTELSLEGGTDVQSLSINATLDNAASLQARQARETVEQTLNRLSAGLQQRGFIRE